MSKRIGYFSLLTIVIISLFVLAGCSQEKTQTPMPIPVTGSKGAENTIITLPDGSIAELIPGTAAGVIVAPATGETSLTLENGSVLLISNLGIDTWFSVQTPKGYSARIKGCSMAVTYSASDDTLEVECTNGNCELNPDRTHSYAIQTGNSLVYKGGVLQEMQKVDEAALSTKFVSNFKECVVVPVTGGNGTPTPTLAPAATRPIATVQPTAVKDFAATATAACKAFKAQFPATPCP
jgi:ferric-dicitrate binding protein FerR (iron transport regulator)